MKQIICALALFACASVIAAADEPADSGAVIHPAASIAGRIAKIDGNDLTLQLMRGHSGILRPVKLNAQTMVIAEDGNPGTVGDLKPGQWIKVTFAETVTDPEWLNAVRIEPSVAPSGATDPDRVKSPVVLHVARTGQEGSAESFVKGVKAGRGDYARIVRVLKNDGPDQTLVAGSGRESWVLIYHKDDEPLPVGEFTAYLRPKVNEKGPCDYWLEAVAKDASATQSAISSKPFEKDGVRVSVTLPKANFAADEPLKFKVEFKNVSDKPFNLLNADGSHYRDWQIRFKKQGQGNWRVFGFDQEGMLKPSVVPMEPGRALAVSVAMDGMDLTGVARILSDDYQQQVAWSDGKRHPLMPGKYLLAVRIELRDNPNDPKPAARYWAGQITTEPVEFEITGKPAVQPQAASRCGRDG